MTPLRNKIERIGEIEFPIKALMAISFGTKDIKNSSPDSCL